MQVLVLPYPTAATRPKGVTQVAKLNQEVRVEWGTNGYGKGRLPARKDPRRTAVPGRTEEEDEYDPQHKIGISALRSSTAHGFLQRVEDQFDHRKHR